VSSTEWGRRAEELYQPDYATRYRAVDEDIRHGTLVETFGGWLRRLSESFGREITALDLGCGTGRYFWALKNVRELVGIDVSEAMLAQARTPVDAAAISAGRITLLQGDFLSQTLADGSFDLIYSIGVLAEHSPLDDRLANRVFRWLAPGGAFAFTAVHPLSFSVPRTWKRRVGEWLLPFSGGGVKNALRAKLMSGGLYADEARLRELLPRHGFHVESVVSHLSDVHLHLMCVARKPA
jgi:SAM-dependent methyltransferase